MKTKTSQKENPSIKTSTLLTLSCLGTALVAGIATWGMTTLVHDQGAPSNENPVVTKSVEATSSDIYSQLGTIPGSWVDFNDAQDDGASFGSKFVSSVDGTCTYKVDVEKMKSNVTGVDGKTLSTNKLMQTVNNRDTSKADFSSLNVNTSNGEIAFVQLVANSSFDTGEGKKKQSKTAYLHYTFTEVPTAENEYPAISVTYTCQDANKWSEEEFKGLLDVTELNINGKKFETEKTSQ